TNQVTHFYSKRKNTAEMIKMLEKLVVKYHDQDRIFLSWDAASWHASKAFVQRVDAINAERGNAAASGPRVELAPLPSGAQFLNVIESVFSGMARAVIHNATMRLSTNANAPSIDIFANEMASSRGTHGGLAMSFGERSEFPLASARQTTARILDTVE